MNRRKQNAVLACLALTCVAMFIAIAALGVWLLQRPAPTPVPFVSPILTRTAYLPLVVRNHPRPVEHGLAGQGSCEQMQAVGASWYYNWSPQTGLDCLEFVPMIWQPSDIGSEISDSAAWLFGFNECGIVGQCPATSYEAALAWRELEAEYPDVKLVSPSFLGWYGYSFIEWFQNWHEAYVAEYGEAPRLDAVAAHCYGSDAFCQEFLTEVIEYVDTIGGYPVWVTEFSNPPMEGVTYTQTLASMEAMVGWFKGNPRIARWGWFALTYKGDEPWLPDFWVEPYSRLVDYDTGELTDCGELYRELGR